MRHYLLFALFTLGFILSIIERIQFERKKKHEKDEEYRSLFRRHSTLRLSFLPISQRNILSLSTKHSLENKPPQARQCPFFGAMRNAFLLLLHAT